MNENIKNSNLFIVFLVSVSIFGLLLSNFFVFKPATPEDNFTYRTLITATIFVIICILGILAALFPNSCLAISQFWKSSKRQQKELNIHKKTWHAHHPSCENFASHILSIGSLKFCATCSGLIVGATLAIICTILYFFGSLSIGEPNILILVGTSGVALGLIQSALPKISSGLTRLLASISFVLGTSLMLISIDIATNNIFIDLFFIILSLLWILTKISLSQKDHRLTCLNCSIEICKYNKKGIC